MFFLTDKAVWLPVVLAALVLLPAGASASPDALTRADVRELAFGSSKLPRALPALRRDVRDARFPYAARVDRLTVRLPHGFTSVSYLLWPRGWNGRTAIFHNGHAQPVDANEHVLRWFLARRYRVVTMAMPLAGENAAPGYSRQGLHDVMEGLERPLRYFLLPVVAVVNVTGATVMGGLSGGGWTTVMAAAIDPRIKRSFPVAGATPMPWRCQPARPGCEGDLEFRLIDEYVALYGLGSGRGQRTVALFNLHDPCCFAGYGFREWAPLVRGNFRALTDPISKSHAITAWHLSVIGRQLAR